MNRQERRAAERAAIKLARKQAKQQTPATEPKPAISETRLAAHQANAQLSTGPRTTAGKAASSQNSCKHDGLYSRKLVLPDEDPAELDALRAALVSEHQPQTDTERILVTEMADQYWRLRRARRLEADFLAQEEIILAHLAAAQRMMTAAERGFYKALKSLTELQKSRGFVPQKQSVEVTGAPPAGFVPQNQPIRAASAAPGVGFVPQKDRIRAAPEGSGLPGPTDPSQSY